MVRSNLLERGYHFDEKKPKKTVITAVWILFFVFLLTAYILCAVFIGINAAPDTDSGILEGTIAFGIFLIIPLYFSLKCILTSFFCLDKKENIKMKMLEDMDMPVCACREALKIWQTVLIYLAPTVLAYLMMCLTNILAGFYETYVILVFIMSFFMSFDLTLIIYVVYVKIKYNPDYIAVNKHVYNVTLYTKKGSVK